jgi:hypothetical protein
MARRAIATKRVCRLVQLTYRPKALDLLARLTMTSATRSHLRLRKLIHGRVGGASHARDARRWVSRLLRCPLADRVSSADMQPNFCSGDLDPLSFEVHRARQYWGAGTCASIRESQRIAKWPTLPARRFVATI